MLLVRRSVGGNDGLLMWLRRILCDEKLRHLNRQSVVLRIVNYRVVRNACSMARTKRGANACRILLGNLLENGRQLCKYNIKVGPIKLGCKESRRMELAQSPLEVRL